MNDSTEVSNPFTGPPPADSTALATVEQSRAVAEVQAALIIGKRFPRDERKAVDKILQACTRPALAEAALYAYSRGGTEITGPSIRMAEAIAQAWGNLEFGWREISRGIGAEKTQFSEVEAFAWDVETNVRRTQRFVVKHWRDTKQGGYPIRDERDIYELCANMAARRMRACILNLIPGDVTEAAVSQVETTLATKFEITPDFIAKTIETFAKYNVTKAMLEKRMQRNLEAMTPALFQQLVKIKNSLRDGMSEPADWFEVNGAPETAPPAATSPKRKSEAKAAKVSVDPTGPDLPDVPF